MSNCPRILLLCCCVALAMAADEPRAAVAAPQGASDAYVLYPGDLVEFRVFDHADLTTAIRVPGDGTADFPLIGRVEVTERKLEEVTGEIAKRLQDGFVRNPKVTATVTQFGSREIYVTGNVAHPMSVALNPVATLTAAQAIGQAGGFLADANR
ncbi:MAG: polysaccharide export protein, partial [Planctomycetes bacterium]|nr:polysaccharide export protein [Planctomycetota bacterium]